MWEAKALNRVKEVHDNSSTLLADGTGTGEVAVDHRVQLFRSYGRLKLQRRPESRLGDGEELACRGSGIMSHDGENMGLSLVGRVATLRLVNANDRQMLETAAL
jgi:hypothetical protein